MHELLFFGKEELAQFLSNGSNAVATELEVVVERQLAQLKYSLIPGYAVMDAVLAVL